MKNVANNDDEISATAAFDAENPIRAERRALARFAGLAAAALVLPGLLAACSKEAPHFNSVDLTGADYARDFSLADAQGAKRTLADFRGKVVAVFFGYTHCPDFCPTTMAELAQVKKDLGADGSRLQALFVTVDPQRDTADNLKNYVTAFDPSFLALRPDSQQQLAALAKDFKVYYKKVEGKTPESYTMDHSAGMYLYDPQGHLRLYSRYGTDPKLLESDIRQLLKA